MMASQNTSGCCQDGTTNVGIGRKRHLLGSTYCIIALLLCRHYFTYKTEEIQIYLEAEVVMVAV